MRYNKLLGLIAARGWTHGEFAKKIGMDPSIFSMKVNSKRTWVKADIDKILEELGATYEEVFEGKEENA